MTRTGRLRIELSVTRLDGTPLAVQGGDPNPLAAATNRVRNAGFSSGNRATVAGDLGTIDGQQVIFMTAITRPPGVAFAEMTGDVVGRFGLESAETLPTEVSPDLDPRLQWWIARRRAGESKAATASTMVNEIAVIARVTRAASWEGLSEVRTPTLIGRTSDKHSIVTGRIPISRIEAIRALPFIKSLKAAQDLETQLSATTSETNARPAGMPTGHLSNGGTGVVVGVIDYGGDFAHQNFRRGDGGTRLLALWHQDAPSTASSPFGYGREHLTGSINLALQQPDPYAALGYDPTEFDDNFDPGAHGTHVMDIAAGNGRGSSTPGMAPNADLVFVNISHEKDPLGKDVVGKSFGDSVRLLEAAKYIFEKAGTRPCVINVSLGTNGGPHDGTTLVDQGLDAMIEAKPNRAIVVAAANAFADGIHAAGKVPKKGTVELQWQVLGVPPRDIELEIWYAGSDRFTVELLDPSGASRALVGPGANQTLSVGSKTVFIANRLKDPNNGDNMIGVFFARGIAPGTYTVRLKGDVVSDGKFHAWIERDNDFASRFKPPHDNSHTIGSVSCSKLSIAVGSYDAHKTGRPLSFFSSAGPTRDGRQKPEISAPGHDVRAALSGSGDGTRLMSGTSMAAPAVAGVIALMFDEARKQGRNLTTAEVRQILIDTARRLPPAGTKWHAQYGNGRVAANAAVSAVIQLANGGGGPVDSAARRRKRSSARRRSGTRRKSVAKRRR
jgi:subtilisin family serine protease